MESLPPLLTIREIAEDLRVSRTTVRKWIEEGHLPAICLPVANERKHYRVCRDDYEAFKRSLAN